MRRAFELGDAGAATRGEVLNPSDIRLAACGNAGVHSEAAYVGAIVGHALDKFLQQAKVLPALIQTVLVIRHKQHSPAHTNTAGSHS